MSYSIFKGVKVVILPKFDPEVFLQVLQDHKVRFKIFPFFRD